MLDLIASQFSSVQGGLFFLVVAFLVLMGVNGAIQAALNSQLSVLKRISWAFFNLVLPGNAILYFISYNPGGITNRTFLALEKMFGVITGIFLGDVILRRIGIIASVILAFLIFTIMQWLAVHNSKYMLKDHINSYWCESFDEMHAQRMAKTMPQYDAIIKNNDENAFTYYRRGKLKEESERKSGISDFQISLKLVTNSLEDEDDPKRLDMLKQFKANVEAELNKIESRY